nr:MAG TPA: head to tail adaptor [Caudoviricetes sp.]
MSNALNERYRQYLKAEQAILVTGQSYRIGNRLLTRADLSAIQAEINRLRAMGATEDDSAPASEGYRRAKRVLFRD